MAPRSPSEAPLGAQEAHLGLNLEQLGHKQYELHSLDLGDSQKDQKKIEKGIEDAEGGRQGRTPLSRSLTKIFDLDQLVLSLLAAPQGCGAGLNTQA